MLEGIPLFPEQASNLAPEVDNLYFFVTAVTAFVALLVVFFVIVFAVKYRDRTGEKIGAPTFSPVGSRNRTAKIITATATSSAKNAVTAVTKKYRLSTSGARLDACWGKSGNPKRIYVDASGTTERRMHLAAAHEHDEAPDKEDGQHTTQANEIHDQQPVPTALRVVMKAVQQQLVDDTANLSLT